jgi:hypothetical protein
LGSSLDAVIHGQANDVNFADSIVFQISSKLTPSNTRILEWIGKGGIHLHPFVLSLLDNLIDLVDIKFRHQLGTRGILYAVYGPKTRLVALRGIVGVYDFREGFERPIIRFGMIRGE